MATASGLRSSEHAVGGGGAPGDAATDEAFGKVAARHVEMAKHAAAFAGRIESRDRLAEGIEHALVGVMHRAALGVRHDRPDLGGMKGRRRYRQHAAGRAAEGGV